MAVVRYGRLSLAAAHLNVRSLAATNYLATMPPESIDHLQSGHFYSVARRAGGCSAERVGEEVVDRIRKAGDQVLAVQHVATAEGRDRTIERVGAPDIDLRVLGPDHPHQARTAAQVAPISAAS